ncbi:Uncharacterized protein dnm_084510 [Desulfonema magnum]|uniref:Uncharacterized protein n=1 Tax=Desulfonema magnum TaxID=45655 RepID=A0A975BVQ4_9BACT|nr:Uncharacterized protein dnm_084510 [Desulfonema magnum]
MVRICRPEQGKKEQDGSLLIGIRLKRGDAGYVWKKKIQSGECLNSCASSADSERIGGCGQVSKYLSKKFYIYFFL